MLEFRLLGPVGVWTGGQRVGLGRAESAKARCVLATLLRTPGVLVTTDALVERVWGDRPPGSAVRYKYIGWLRSALAPYGVSLAHRDEGYVLHADAEQVDLHRFRRLMAAARRASGEDHAVERRGLLDQALGLWRGPALSGLSGAWAGLFREQLERERRDALVLAARCALESKRFAEAARWLAGWETEYPTDEEIIALHMTALDSCGQRAQALLCYRRARERLHAAFGAEPGVELESVHRRLQAPDTPADHTPANHVSVLKSDRGERRPAPGRALPARGAPRQLPAVTRTFTGRARQLAALDGLLDGPERSGDTVVISAITGGAGIGKTALAVHWAHRIAERFPDGQLFLNLRGFDPGTAQMTAQEALRSILGALGTEPGRIPLDPQAQAALYRSLLADRRMLVVLDNARDAEQVRPLLPGGPTCLVIVTSRNRLTGLIAAEGAHPVQLDLLTEAEARELLAGRIGPDRVAAESAAIDAIVARSGGLPLALVVIAARAAVGPDADLAVLAGQLDDTTQLDAFAAGDPATDIRLVFSWSVQALSAPAARLFRLLGLHPGPGFAIPAVASLAGLDPARTGQLLAELADAHLLTEEAPGRYGIHDLFRIYAAEQAELLDGDEERRAAVHRMLNHYLHLAHHSTLLLYPSMQHTAPEGPAPGADLTRPADPDQALAWLTTEHPVLIALVDRAASVRFDTHAWQLAWALSNFLDRQGYWHDRLAVHTTALAAARRRKDRLGEARMHVGLGNAHARMGRLDDAYSHLCSALDKFQTIGDRPSQAGVHLTLSFVFQRQGDEERVLAHAQAALDLYTAAADLRGKARALHEIGWHHALHGRRHQAYTYCRQALDLLETLDDRYGQAGAWDSLGYIHHHGGDPVRAISCYQRSLDLLDQIDDRPHQAEVLVRLGDARLAADDDEAVRDAWTRAVAIFDEIGHPDSAEVRAKLERLGRIG